MTNSITNTITIEPNVVRVATIRRQIPAELSRLDEIIKAECFQDVTSLRVSKWIAHFQKDLRLNPDADAIKKAFCTFLKGILKDPWTQKPLNADAVLANDGFTYNLSTLQEYKRLVPAPHNERSPFDPHNPNKLETTAHPLLPLLFEWLETHDQKEEPRQVTAVMPSSSSSSLNRLQNLLNKTKEQRNEVEKRANAIFTQGMSQIEANRLKDKEMLQAVKKQIEEEKIAITNLHEKLEYLETKISDVESNQDETKIEILKLERLATITKIEIEEANKTNWGAIFTAVAIGVACYFAAPYINAAFGSLASTSTTTGTAYVAPTPAGRGAYIGAKLHF